MNTRYRWLFFVWSMYFECLRFVMLYVVYISIAILAERMLMHGKNCNIGIKFYIFSSFCRLDQILGKQGSKAKDVYASKISLASRIVKVERQVYILYLSWLVWFIHIQCYTMLSFLCAFIRILSCNFVQCFCRDTFSF